MKHRQPTSRRSVRGVTTSALRFVVRFDPFGPYAPQSARR